MLTVRPVFAIPVQGEHERLAERTLAVARAFVAASAVVAVSIGRLAPVPNATPTYTVLGGYILFACVAVLCLHFTPGRWPVPAPAMHAVDVAVAAAITLCTSDVNGPFFVLFLFTLLAAAYRWGFAATLLTASAGILVLLVDTAYQSVFNASFAGGVESDRLIMRSGGLLLAGALTGYLAQSEQRLRSELTTIAAILSRADIRTGLKRTMAFVFDAVIRLFDARRMLLVIHEVATERVFVWDGARSADGSVQALQASRLDLNDLPAYLFEPRAAAWHAVRRSGARQDAFDVLALDSAGSRLKTQAWDLPPAFLEAVPRFERLMAVGVEAGTEW